MKIILASHNKGKIREVKEIFEPYDVEIVSMEEVGFTEDIEETGTTYEENSILKARTIADKTGYITIADDSGLEVKGLNWQPGVYSARFLGENTPYSMKMNQILNCLEGLPEEARRSKYVSVVAVSFPNTELDYTVRGEVLGSLAYEQRGDKGFGYDPLFIADGYERTMGELDAEEKNEISHRGLAMKKMAEWLESNIGLVKKSDKMESNEDVLTIIVDPIEIIAVYMNGNLEMRKDELYPCDWISLIEKQKNFDRVERRMPKNYKEFRKNPPNRLEECTEWEQ